MMKSSNKTKTEGTKEIKEVKTPAKAEIITKGEKRYIKTPKGTELPLLIIERSKKNSDGSYEKTETMYLQVAHRIVWFLEERSDWQIITHPRTIDYDKKYAVFRAFIKDKTGRVVSTGTKSESIAGFPDYIEKAETGAVGRALALCGFGTQFAPELNEEDRLADSPVEVPKKDLEFYRSVKPEPITSNQDAKYNHPAASVDQYESGTICQHCGSDKITVAMTKPDNPRNPNRPYWKCLNCPASKSFSHWVKNPEEHPEIKNDLASKVLPF